MIIPAWTFSVSAHAIGLVRCSGHQSRLLFLKNTLGIYTV